MSKPEAEAEPTIWDQPISWECSVCEKPFKVVIASKFFITDDNKKQPVCQECINLARDTYIKADESNFYDKYKFNLTKKVVVESKPKTEVKK